MGSAENGGGQHPAPEGRKIGTPPPLDVFETFPKKPNIISSGNYIAQLLGCVPFSP